VTVQPQFRAAAGRLIGENGVDVLEAVGVDGGVVGDDFLRREEAARGCSVRKGCAVLGTVRSATRWL
jgi:hypothetical protein